MRRPFLASLPGAVVLLVGCIVAALAGPASAQFVADTVDTFDAPTIAPQLFLEPPNGTPHLGYRRGTSMRHAWRAGGVWMNEAIAEVGSTLFSWGIGPTGRAAALYIGDDSTLICSRRDPAGWSPDTIAAVPPGSAVQASLAVNRTTDEPVVAWRTIEWDAAPPFRLMLGRRTSSGWIVTELDTSSDLVGAPSLALDPAGLPRIAVHHGRGFGPDSGGTWFGESSGPDGPFSWTRIDPYGDFLASLVLDPISAEPRVAYTARGPPPEPDVSAPQSLRYAYRSGGVWTTMEVHASGDDPVPTTPSLALTRSGDPRIVQWRRFNIGPGEPAGGTNPCPGAVATPRVMHYERSVAEGTGPFEVQQVSNSFLASSSALAVASGLGNESRVVWRDPHSYATGCLMKIMYSVKATTTGVPILEPPPIGLAIGPNPLPAGSTLTIAFRLERDADVTLELIDLAGRRVARSTTHVGAGGRSLTWSPAGLRAGVYRLVARTKSATVGQANLIVLR